MKGFKSTSTNPYTYTQDGVWKAGQYTFQAVVLSDSGYAFAFQRSDTTWQTIDLSWQVKNGSYSKIQWTFTLEVDAVANGGYIYISNDYGNTWTQKGSSQSWYGVAINKL